jgi:hypothetical protein
LVGSEIFSRILIRGQLRIRNESEAKNTLKN